VDLESARARVELLTATPNRFQGIVIDRDALPSDPERFEACLRVSLDVWARDGCRVVWLEVPIRHAALIPKATALGFTFHHSHPDRVMMTRRLQPEAAVPLYATHYIGAGGLVINEADELLVVWEKVHRHHHRKYYKLPGGALRPGEHVIDGVMREVREETGVETTFEALMGFRHWHGYRYDKSDIYFICRLRPLTTDIRIQESEIAEAKWMPLEDYLSSEYVGTFNRRMAEAAAKGTGLVPGWFEGYDVSHETHEIFIPDLSGMEVSDFDAEP
jgi:ADP-ribose pyrophosphatase YjhB (NUDIX family)